MGSDWDFYPLLVDNEPASIYVDLDLVRTAPVKGRPNMAYVRIVMRQPRADGLSSNEEFQALCDLEDSLVDGITRDGIATYAGRNTSGGHRDFYFYTSDPEGFRSRASAALHRHSDYEFELGGRIDPHWRVYFEFLYPSADDMQRIQNRRVRDLLEEHGDDLSCVRVIDHVAYLPDEATGASFEQFLHGEGFVVRGREIEDGQRVALHFEREDRPSEIDNVVVPLARRIREFGGQYDGWGCEVASGHSQG